MFVVGESNLLTHRGCCGVWRSDYLLDPRGVLYWSYIYPVQVRMLEAGFNGGSVSGDSVSTESRLVVLTEYRRLAASFRNRQPSIIRQFRNHVIVRLGVLDFGQTHLSFCPLSKTIKQQDLSSSFLLMLACSFTYRYQSR